MARTGRVPSLQGTCLSTELLATYEPEDLVNDLPSYTEELVPAISAPRISDPAMRHNDKPTAPRIQRSAPGHSKLFQAQENSFADHVWSEEPVRNMPKK